MALDLTYFANFQEWYTLIIHHITNYPFPIRGRWSTYFHFIPMLGVGAPILLLALYGTYRVLRDERLGSPLYAPLAFLALFYLYLSLSRGAIPRWAIPITPSLVILATLAIVSLWRQAKSSSRPVQCATVAMFVVLVPLLAAAPLANVLRFNLALVDEPNTYQQLRVFLEEDVSGSGCILSAPRISFRQCDSKRRVSPESLDDLDLKFVVFSEFWFIERRYPLSILNRKVLNKRRHGDWNSIRNQLEDSRPGVITAWELERVIRPRFYSDWSTNIAQPPSFYVYKRVHDAHPGAV